MAPGDPHLLIFIHLHRALLHWARVGALWPREYSRSDEMPLARLGYEWHYRFHHGCSPDLCWISHSRGSQLLCCEQQYGGAHKVRNWSFQPMDVKGLRSPANSNMNELRSRSSTIVEPSDDCSAQPTSWVQLCERPWYRTTQLRHVWVPVPQ